MSAREVFEKYKTADVRQMTEIQRAARYLYLRKLSYGATVRSFGCLGAERMSQIELAKKDRNQACHNKCNV